MRSLRLALRLAGRNLQRRPAQAAMLLLTLTIATGTLGVGMWLYGSADGPWDKVWAKTQGFHVQVDYYTDVHAPHKSANLSRSRSQAMSLARDPRVVAVGGPWPMLDGKLELGSQSEDLSVQVRRPGLSRVDQPLMTAGRWLGRSGGVVLEDGLAHTLHVRPGDTVLIDRHRFHVRGVAMTVSQGRFPLTRPALAWVTPQTARVMRGVGLGQEGFQLEVRLANPADAPAVAAAYTALNKSTPTSTMFTQTWEAQRAASHSDLDILVETVFSAGILIAILTIATAAVIITGRLAAQTRQVGTLKAVGVTPGQVVLVLLIEYLGVAALATVIGLSIGRLIAPALASTSLTILGAPELPPLSLTRAGIVAAVAFAVVLLATVRPALRGIRDTTLRSLASGARPPRRRAGRIGRIAARSGAPLTAVLGLRSARRRPGQLLTNATGLALGVAMIVVALGLHASLGLLKAERAVSGHALNGLGIDSLYGQVRMIVLGTAGLLLVLGTINAFIVAAFAARDSARNHAAMRAVGATPRQTVTTLIVSQLGACLWAVAIGIPLGLGLWSLIEGGDLPRVPVSGASLALLAVAVPVAFAAIVSIPARLLARRPVAPLLTYE
jgi:putative ABC transport system permease protein